MKNYPSLSIITPVYNEEKNLKKFFKSFKNQTYPKNKIEFIIIDDDSSDRSVEIATEYGAKIIKVKTHDIAFNKRLGLKKAENDLVYNIDADIEICSNDFLEKLIAPFLDNEDIVGCFTKEFALDAGKPVKNSLLRFISYHPLQQDPLYQLLSPSIESTVVQKKEKYFLCNFVPGKIPAVGRIIYRRKNLLKAAAREKKVQMDLDLETTEIVARSGFNYFAYVPDAKLRHYHAFSLGQLVKKRLRNLKVNLLPNVNKKYYIWFNPHSLKDILKIILWVFWANLFLPETLRGIIKSVSYRDPAFMWHPVVSIATTDAIIWGFLSDQSGRKFIRKVFKGFVK